LRRIADGGFWVGFLTYDLGRAIEHIETRTQDDLGLPDVVFARFDDLQPIALDELECEPVALGAGRSSLTRAEHEARVHAVQELLRAGECYQVNLTRRIAYDAAPDPVALFNALARANPAPHAGLLALDGLAVVSASPESFLRVDGRSVETRPIKGTAVDAAALLASAKDRAENVMIVDLARNDLGRVCEFGSIAVPDLMEIEEHPGLHHLVSTVTGTLRAGVRLDELVRATFPPASVTGAPKPRVLQAIEDLEPVRRGVYCGAFGWIDADRGRADLAVAIRTFTIAGPRTYLGVGGGIVADSVASREWAETELKAARLLGAVGAYEAEPVSAQ
jgi:para-aminobenzoate synthetase component 1